MYYLAISMAITKSWRRAWSKGRWLLTLHQTHQEVGMGAWHFWLRFCICFGFAIVFLWIFRSISRDYLKIGSGRRDRFPNGNDWFQWIFDLKIVYKINSYFKIELGKIKEKAMKENSSNWCWKFQNELS